MTDNNEDRISKLFVQIIMENELSKMSLNDFRKAIEDNLPQSISREAVEELRNRWESEKSNRAYNESDYDRMGEFIQDLDQLLISNPQHDTKKI